MIMIIMYL